MRTLRRPVRRAYFETLMRWTRRRLPAARAPRSFERVRIVGMLDNRNGIASGARLQYDAMKALGVDVQLVDASPARGRAWKGLRHSPGTAYVFHSGGPETINLLWGVLRDARDAYRIAYWAWELSAPPTDWPEAEGVYDEIWTPSDFARDSLRQRYDTPVLTVPHRVPADAAARPSVGRPFTVLAVADSRSSLDRKNPIAAVRAFDAAFGTSPDARLVLKLNGGAPAPGVLPDDLPRRDNVRVVYDYLSVEQLRELFRGADVLLSLHRAEGFGLPMLEAMACGKPVVATGWSGNTDFMTDANSVLVPYTLVPVRDGSVYRGYGHDVWAEPDVAAAAAALRRLATDPAHYADLAGRALATARALAASWQLPAEAPGRNPSLVASEPQDADAVGIAIGAMGRSALLRPGAE